MDGFEYTKQFSDTIVEICFDTVGFTRLFDQGGSDSDKNLFHCNDGIEKGLEWFMGSDNVVEMCNGIESYIKSVEYALNVYSHIILPFENKDKLISILQNLRDHLMELKRQIIN